jgi:hypothetical protein
MEVVIFPEDDGNALNGEINDWLQEHKNVKVLQSSLALAWVPTGGKKDGEFKYSAMILYDESSKGGH